MPVRKIDAEGYSLLIVLVSDGVECRVTYIHKGSAVALTAELLHAHLQDAGIHFGIDTAALDRFCAGVAAAIPQEKVLLASGIPPEPGCDGRLAFPTQEADEPPAEDEEDHARSVDLRRVKGLNSIKAGDVVATIQPPVPGRAGTSVTGDPIEPHPVSPVAVTLGSGVSLSADGQTIIADVAGRIVHQDNQLSISEEFVVKGHVDFKVGHIDFDGIVIVEGDILDDFNVRAGKGLIVGGAVGACSLESGGNIQICGMSGQGRGTIRCHGIVFARYLNEVDIEVDGSVIVEKEILKSAIRATGVVMCDGHLAGGSCVARGGIEAKVLGSSSGLATELVAGADYRDLAALTELYAQLDDLTGKMAATGDREQLETLTSERKHLQKEVMALKSKQYDNANAKLNVQGMIEDQVQLTLGETTQSLAGMKGPVSLIENMAEGGFSVLKLTPLDVKASVLRMEAAPSTPTPYPRS